MLRKQHYRLNFWQRTRPAKVAYQTGKALGTIARFFSDSTFRKQAFCRFTAPILTAASFAGMLAVYGVEEAPIDMNYSLWV